MTAQQSFPNGTVLGYPRLGPRRELKKAIESFWKNAITAEELEKTAASLRSAVRNRLHSLGLRKDDSSIPESFSFYDQVLDAAVTVGAIPERFRELEAADRSLDLAGYFAVARGYGNHLPVEMTKWFDTNYHYSVPEIGPETEFSLANERLISQFEEAVAEGFLTRPTIVGPVTLLALSKPSVDSPEGFRPLSRLHDVLPVYQQLLSRWSAAGAQWVQLDESALVSESLDDDNQTLLEAAAEAYRVLGETTDRPQLFVATSYDSLDKGADVLAHTSVEAIGLDLVKGSVPLNTDALAEKTVVAGVVDGHNVWRGDLAAALDVAQSLVGAAQKVAVSTSTSLIHVPHDVNDEPLLSDQLKSWLAFADQKVQQIAVLAQGLSEGKTAIAQQLSEAAEALENRRSAAGVAVSEVRQRTASLQDGDFSRPDYRERREEQTKTLGLPDLPTTTIGSFPQTTEIRKQRAKAAKGEITQEQYQDFLREEIKRVVDLQEEIGLDVLVHGEPERNDMVQYFAENFDGFAVTQNGWVQSYGTRATRPSILWGDVSRQKAFTVDWITYAQQLTSKPVKGMLTGPVTILAWSFVRDDQPLKDTAYQVALALRDEIDDLQKAGVKVIQVDEPALRELLPLKKENQPAYLKWSVDSFRLATAGATADTQIHTHLCYSEFGVVIDAIKNLDADVTSIEAARSKMEVVEDLEKFGFDHGVGPGVYDIHSPRVPDVAEIRDLLNTGLKSLPAEQLWVNPDCGLKTRGYDETVQSLRNMLQATREIRAGAESATAVPTA